MKHAAKRKVEHSPKPKHVRPEEQSGRGNEERPDEPARPEIPTTPNVQEIPERSPREIAQRDRERAENEGMPQPPAPQPTQVEGEDSATRRSREGVERLMPGGQDELASEAARTLEAPESKTLRKANRDPKHGHAGRARVRKTS